MSGQARDNSTAPGRNRNRVVLSATCRTCAGEVVAGYTNVAVTKLPDGRIEFDPHVTGLHTFTVDEHNARALVAKVLEWLG